MAIRTKLFTTTTLALSIGAFGVFAGAQTTETPATDGQKIERGDRKGKFGNRGKFGKRGGMRHHRGMRGGMGMFRGIELTEAQKEQLKAIREANKPTGEHKALFDSLRETRKAGGTISEEQKAQMKQLREDRKAKMAVVREQMLAILTPEQKTQLEARKAEMQQKREQFRQKRQEMREKRKAEAKPAQVS